MDPTLAMILGVFMRWVHIMSVVILIGGVFYARGAGSKLAPWFTSKIYWLSAALVGAGLYNYLMKPSYPPRYHMWFGIKFLLALHVLAMLVLLTRPVDDAKRARWMTSIIYSGTAVIAISAILRWLSLSPVVKLP